MKIAIIEPVGGHGGMHYYDFNLAEGLADAGIKVVVYTCDKTDVPPNLPFEVKLTFKKIWGDANKILRAYRFTLCLIKTLLGARRNHVELVHFHFFHYTLMENMCVTFAKFLCFKLVITTHDVESFAGKFSGRAARNILEKADKIIAHNTVTKNALIHRLHLPVEKIEIIPHGNYVNNIPDRLKSVTIKHALNLPDNSPILLFFGQIKEVKGLDLLLKALPLVLCQFPDTKLVIAGKIWKDDFSIYEKLIKKHTLQGNIELHLRYIPDNEAPLFFYSADVIVLPYRKIYQSGVLLMAMSYGACVLASALAGMNEVIQDGVTGFLFPKNNVERLAERLIYLLSNSSIRSDVGKRGHIEVKEHYSWSTIGHDTSLLYHELTD